MKLFHGTNIDFDNIELKMSKPNKDFGQGFYLSDTRQQAEELAMSTSPPPEGLGEAALLLCLGYS